MGGISKHYILTCENGHIFDKKITPHLDLLLTRTWSHAGANTIIRRREEYEKVKGAVLPWRKKIILMWTLCKSLTSSTRPDGWVLKEYSVRRGRGFRHYDAFKRFAKDYRSFKFLGKKKDKLLTPVFNIGMNWEAPIQMQANVGDVVNWREAVVPDEFEEFPDPPRLADAFGGDPRRIAPRPGELRGAARQRFTIAPRLAGNPLRGR